ncbi:MAG: AAA family ATPase [Clostridia bacterium]|jgi:chromosome partitioning protein|nr:AAA family ATPase [Clostridia bacterium]MDD4571265.1 AAA family ATPase [Clostridia bacterium]
MSTIISVSNQKGGVGKTTTTCSLGAALKQKGLRVLLIDLDPQGNLGFSIGADTDTAATIYDVLKGEAKIQYAIQKTPAMDIITSSILLSAIELEFTNTGREFLLQEAIKPILKLYDYILIDTPPALGILTINAFTASNSIIVPMLSDIFSLQGIYQLHETVERVRKYCNPNLMLAGILLTKFNPRTLLSREIQGTAQLIAQALNLRLFETHIRNSVAASEAQSVQKSILDYAPKNNVAKDYIKFANELLAKGV